MSLVYFGAGTDFEPAVELDEIKTFHYVDALPNTKHYQGCAGEWIDDHFVEVIEYALNKLGWECVEKSDDHLLYRKGDRQFYYYMNCNVETDAETRQFSKDLLKSCSHVFIRGYLPKYLKGDSDGDYLRGKVVYVTDNHEDDINTSKSTECIMVTDNTYACLFNRDLRVHFIHSKGYPEWML